MRGDLEMPPGKLSAQAGHCFSATLLQYLKRHQAQLDRFAAAEHSGSRITLKADNLGQLQRAYEQALAAGLPTALFSDSGHVLPPHFLGQPIITGLGIGPATREQMRHITKRFRCM